MFGIEELKESIKITETTVEYTVKGCQKTIPKMTKKGVNLDSSKEEIEPYQCPKHNIYISPLTFKYQSELDNLLWKEKADLDLFYKIKKVKRES